MTTIQPLSEMEQQMAEQYHYLVDQFLYRKGLPHDEYYDVVIFGYLSAIQRECRSQGRPEVQNFYGLVEVCMQRAVGQEWRSRKREIRRSLFEGVSLDAVPAHTDSGEFSFYEILADRKQNTAVAVENRDLTERILAVATPREREAVDLACLGYEPREIADLLGIAGDTCRRTLCNFRAKAKAVRDDREVIRSPQWVRNKEKVQAWNRAYREAHREELNEKARARYDPEKERAKSRAYYARHREEIRAKARARWAKKYAAKQGKKEAASSAANTGDGKAEQITTPVSASILTDEKEDCKR